MSDVCWGISEAGVRIWKKRGCWNNFEFWERAHIDWSRKLNNWKLGWCVDGFPYHIGHVLENLSLLLVSLSLLSRYLLQFVLGISVSCYPLVLFGLSLSTCSVNSGCQNRVATQIHKRIVRARSGRHPECWLIMRLVCAKGKKVHTFSNWWYVTREITLTFASKTRQARYKISAEGFVKRQNGSNLKSSATTWSSQDSKAVSEIGAWVTGECNPLRTPEWRKDSGTCDIVLTIAPFTVLYWFCRISAVLANTPTSALRSAIWKRGMGYKMVRKCQVSVSRGMIGIQFWSSLWGTVTLCDFQVWSQSWSDL